MKTGGTMMLGSSGLLELKNADGRRTTKDAVEWKKLVEMKPCVLELT
jgi:hypothetical protein